MSMRWEPTPWGRADSQKTRPHICVILPKVVVYVKEYGHQLGVLQNWGKLGSRPLLK